jgi:hypothetical protein
LTERQAGDCTLARGSSHGETPELVFEQLDDAGGESVAVTDIDDPAREAVCDQVGNAADLASDDRHTAGHRFHHGQRHSEKPSLRNGARRTATSTRASSASAGRHRRDRHHCNADGRRRS